MDLLTKYKNFIYLLLSWAVVGAIAGPIDYILVPVSVLMLKSKSKYMEIFIGFFFILILSDSRGHYFDFASDVKEIYIVLLTFFMITDKKSFSPMSKLPLAFIPFFVVAFICLTNAPSDNILGSLQKTVSYVLLLVVVPNYVQRSYLDKKDEFLRALVFFGALILLLGLFLMFASYDVSHMEGRYRGIFGNPNGLGVFCLLLILLFAIIIEYRPALFERREKMFIYALILLSIVLCGSRSTLFAILIFFALSYSYRVSPFLGFFVFIVIGGIYSYVSTNIISIAYSLGLEKYLRVETITEASGRFVAWSFAWQNINLNFYIGRGFDYTNYIFFTFSKYLSALGHQGNAHNSYITLWLDTGLLGLVTFVFAFIRSFFMGVKKTRLTMPILYSVIFSSFFESWLTASLNPFTIIVFIILSVLTSDIIVKYENPAPVAVPV